VSLECRVMVVIDIYIARLTYHLILIYSCGLTVVIRRMLCHDLFHMSIQLYNLILKNVFVLCEQKGKKTILTTRAGRVKFVCSLQ